MVSVPVVLDDEEGRLVASQAIADVVVGFGPRLVSAHLIGSLAHDGFVVAVSDVDVALILDGDEPGDRARVEEITRRTAERDRSPLAQRLSLFWTTIASLRDRHPQGRLPAIDWLDLLDSGQLVYGAALPPDIPRPTGLQLVADSATFAVSKWREDRDWAGRLLNAEALVSEGRRAASKAALFPVRFLYTLATGLAGGTHHAVDWYVGRPHAPARELVSTAYQWRIQGINDEAAAAHLLQQQLVPLYREFGDSYRQRLTEQGLEHLADALHATIAQLDP